PRWAKLLGRDEAALEPTVATWKALAHPDDRPLQEAALDAHVTGLRPTFQLEHRLRHADGHWVWVLARGAALRGHDGRAQRVAGSITDITERVEAVSLLERRVRERTADLSALLELSNSTALTLELRPLLAQILERLEAAVGCSGATVYEQAPGEAFRRIAGRGDEPGADPELLASALATREPRSLDHAGGTRLAIPLVVRDAVLGALLLEQPQPDDGGERRRLTVAFANQLGVALENARLYQQVGERAALEERQHLARELHDSVSQALYAILLGTHTAQRELSRSPDAAQQALDYVENLAQAGIKEMRALIFVLRPESLEKEGRIGVLRKQLDVLETRHDLAVSLEAPAEPAADVTTKQALYRIAQEALHNVVKHARATHVRVALTTADGRVRLSVADDGIGFDRRHDDPEHLGLRSMQERARQIHGTLRVDSREGEGTTVTVEAPCGPSDGAEGADAGSAGPNGPDDETPDAHGPDTDGPNRDPA
ncbi:MAG: histidine kinase, partial [Deinococcales bacterium]